MSQHTAPDATEAVAEGFTATARDYDATVRHNMHGANRLVASLPTGEYRCVLDVGCGTGWSSIAMIERFGCREVTGVDPAQGMLDVFEEKLGALDGVTVDLRKADVMDMGVAPASFDAVISSMAMHWFPDKPGATKAMAAALAPGGVLGILCSGRGGEHAFREVLASVDPPAPASWDAAFDAVQRDVDEMEEYLTGAGLDVIDVWMERRLRRSTVEAYLERMRVVAGHITAGELDEAGVAALMERIRVRMHEASGPRGFEYMFTKLYAVARKPG